MGGSRCDDHTTQNAKLASYTRNIKKNYEQESHTVGIATTVIMVTSLIVISS